MFHAKANRGALPGEDSRQRLERVIEYARREWDGVLSVETLAGRLDPYSGHKLSLIRYGLASIDWPTAEALHRLYPAFGVPWLVTGEGVHPGWPVPYSGSLYTTWGLVCSYRYDPHEGEWTDRIGFEFQKIRIEFRPDGTAALYEREFVDTCGFRYDARRWRLAWERSDCHIVRLTPSRLELVECGRGTDWQISKWVYRRDPDIRRPSGSKPS